MPSSCQLRRALPALLPLLGWTLAACSPADPSYTITGAVRGPAIAGVTISLGGARSATATTGADGTYGFSGLRNGSYTVTPSRAGYSFAPSSTPVTIDGAHRPGVDFEESAAMVLHGLSGAVKLAASGGPLPGVSLTLATADAAVASSTTSAADGSYAFAGLGSGTYTVTPALASYTFVPASITTTLGDRDVALRDFEATPANTGGTARVARTGAGSIPGYHLADGEDGAVTAGTVWPEARFVVAGDVVTDTLTGLMWARDAGTPTVSTCAGGDMTWAQADRYVACLNSIAYLGHSDWRLPSIRELRSLVNYGAPNNGAWLRSSGFSNAAGYSWASTDVAGVRFVWVVGMSYGLVTNQDEWTSMASAWPVRSTEAVATVPAPVAWTGDDRDHAGVAWPDPRFTVTGGDSGAVVRDNLTGLLWPRDAGTPTVSRCTGAVMQWQDALGYVDCLNAVGYLGFSDWRLPNVNELESLVDYSRSNPALPLNHPFTSVQTRGYWSSTTAPWATGEAWVLGGYSGSLGCDWKTNVSQASWYHVWPVRDGR
jgi:hypothetical protein